MGNRPTDFVDETGVPDEAGFEPVPATAGYARFCLDMKLATVPHDVVAIAREQIVATIGSCLGGNHLPGARAMASGLAIMGHGEATLFGRPERHSAPIAALYNGATAQNIDWDDWVLISHVGGCVVPTAFAAAELEAASGARLLEAIIIGNEVAGRTSRAIQRGAYLGNGLPNHQVEAPLVAGHLMGLDDKALRRAVGHSAFMAMENCPIGWTADSKMFINGLPAMWGILSASLARAGMISNQDMIEHPAGYLATVSEAVDQDELLKGLGDIWITRTLNTKRHASCAYNLAGVECAIAIHQRLGRIDPARIRRITLDCPGVTIYVGSRYQAMEPDIYEQYANGDVTHMGLCFDAGFAITAALLDGDLDYHQYLAERVSSPEIQQLRPKVRFRTDADMQRAYYSQYRYGSRLTLELDDGTVVTETREQLLGARDRPFDHAEKFRAGAHELLPPGQVDEALDALRRIEQLPDIRELSDLLRPREPSDLSAPPR